MDTSKPWGDLTRSILMMQRGEVIDYPTSSESAINTVGGLRRAGRTPGRRYTVRKLRAGECRIWRLE